MWWWGLACRAPHTVPTDDPQTTDVHSAIYGLDTMQEGPAVITRVQVACDWSVGPLTLDVETEHWTRDARWYLLDASAIDTWSEEHTPRSYAFDLFGAFDLLASELVTGVHRQDQVADESTVFACDDIDQDRITQALMVWSFDSEDTDCRVWGPDAQALLDGSAQIERWPLFDLSDCTLGLP